jgi:hypothetical protein
MFLGASSRRGYCCHKENHNDYNQVPPVDTHSARKKSERPIAQPYVWPLALQARQTATDCAENRLV